MLIISFFLVFTYSKYASIDLGSQYIRISVSSISSELTMALNHQHKILTPSAIAFKMPDGKLPKNRHLTDKEGFNSTLKVGEDAVKYLKYHPESGTDKITYFLGRYKFNEQPETSKYKIPPKLANTTEMLSIILTKLFMNQQYAGLEGISVVLPRYYTLSQRESVTQAVYLARLPFFGIYDDDSAIIQLYYARFSNKFLSLNKNKMKKVLFVDIGAAGVRAYRVEFYSYGRYNLQPAANQTSYVWSEKTGGFSFNLKLAKAFKISEKKAQKWLIEKKIEIAEIRKYLKDEINEVIRVVKEACNGEIDEVQLFGSASRYSFIQEAIQSIFSNSTSNTKSDTLNFLKQKFFGEKENFNANRKYFNASVKVLRDFPASEALARGALHYLHSLLNESQFKIVEVTKVPIYTTLIECGGVLEDYCVRNRNCSDYVIMHSTICQKLVFIANDESEEGENHKEGENKNKVPDGCGQIIGQYSLTNISKFSYDLTDELNGFLALDSPSPTVISAVWCANQMKEEMQQVLNQQKDEDEGNCEQIETKATPLTDIENKKKYNFIQEVLNGDDEKKLIGDLRSKIDLYLQTLKKSKENLKIETDEKGEDADDLINMAASITQSGSVKEMREFIKKLEKYCRRFGIDFV